MLNSSEVTVNCYTTYNENHLLSFVSEHQEWYFYTYGHRSWYILDSRYCDIGKENHKYDMNTLSIYYLSTCPVKTLCYKMFHLSWLYYWCLLKRLSYSIKRHEVFYHGVI